MNAQRTRMLMALLIVFTAIFLLLLNDRTQFVYSIMSGDPEPAMWTARQRPPGGTPFRRRGNEPAVAGEELQVSSTEMEILGKDCYPRVFQPATDDPSLPDMCKSQSAGQSTRRPVEHVFFLKTHKTGSTTMRMVFNRYALMHNLTLAVVKGNREQIQHTSNFTGFFVPLPPALSHYDMLTDHVRFCEACVGDLLPADAKFVSIVREPLKQFISGFYYHKVEGKPTGDDAVSTYISDMDRWDQPEGSWLHSRMFFDFGLNFTEHHADQSYLPAALNNLTKVFDLICIMERYDESVVLLKRYLAWELRDVLYVKINANKKKRDVQLTERQVQEFRSRRKEDYALYATFVKEFNRKIAAEGDSFPEEVEAFREICATVKKFCSGSKSRKSSAEVIVEPTKFSGGFRVAREDCGYLSEKNAVASKAFDRNMLKRVGIIVK